MDQMLQAIYGLRRTFLRMNLSPPQVVIGNHDEGMRFEAELVRSIRTSPEFSSPSTYPILVTIDGALWHTATLFGDVRVRWPARIAQKPV